MEVFLDLAAKEGNIEQVEMLINKGLTNQGSSALKSAAEQGHLNILKKLMDNKNKPEIDIETISSALKVAVEKDQLKIVEELMKNKNKPEIDTETILDCINKNKPEIDTETILD